MVIAVPEVYVGIGSEYPKNICDEVKSQRQNRPYKQILFPGYGDWEEAPKVKRLVEFIQAAGSYVILMGGYTHLRDVQAVAFLARRTGIQPVLAHYDSTYRMVRIYTLEECKEDPSQWR